MGHQPNRYLCQCGATRWHFVQPFSGEAADCASSWVVFFLAVQENGRKGFQKSPFPLGDWILAGKKIKKSRESAPKAVGIEEQKSCSVEILCESPCPTTLTWACACLLCSVGPCVRRVRCVSVRKRERIGVGDYFSVRSPSHIPITGAVVPKDTYLPQKHTHTRGGVWAGEFSRRKQPSFGSVRCNCLLPTADSSSRSVNDVGSSESTPTDMDYVEHNDGSLLLVRGLMGSVTSEPPWAVTVRAFVRAPVPTPSWLRAAIGTVQHSGVCLF
ncbi:cobalamin-binding protein [Anopheles sinensis]|uniref:Cobalamin-binding protein n=1 Tax=Anopheles sinensis TaxID=74873 RepID=A0A084VEA1_ANOSI|nr:cobalamin-binding protein [Anopheles sinensis]